MNNKQLDVLAKLLELSEPEMNQVIIEVSKRRKTRPFSQQRGLNDSFGGPAQRIMGPTSASCPCCGR